MKEVKIPYGGDSIRLSLRGRLKVLRPLDISPINDVSSSVFAALESPSVGAPLRRRLRAGEPLTVLVSDHTRETGADKFFPPLLSYLADCGIPPESVSVLFANGIHRRQQRAEQEGIVGREVAREVKLVDHDADDADHLARVGFTSSGMDVMLNRLVAEGRPVIATGAVSFHYLAGFGGGRKSIVPGVAGRQTVLAFHQLSLAAEKGSGRHPCARAGVKAGNPLDRAAREAASLLKRTFLLNTGMTQSGHVAALFSGDLGPAFDLATDWCQRYLSVSVMKRFPIVITGGGGSPRDCDLVQAHKALEMALPACLPGGVIVLLAQCAEGLGNRHFSRWFGYPDAEVHEERLREEFEVNGFTAFALRWKTNRFKVMLCSSLSEDIVRSLGMIPVTENELWARIDSLVGDSAQGVVLPVGAIPVLVRVRERGSDCG